MGWVTRRARQTSRYACLATAVVSQMGSGAIAIASFTTASEARKLRSRRSFRLVYLQIKPFLHLL
jgi:hypothetical protein